MNCLGGTDMTCFPRGLAIVLAEDVPAIAETKPPRKSHLYLSFDDLFFSDLNSV